MGAGRERVCLASLTILRMSGLGKDAPQCPGEDVRLLLLAHPAGVQHLVVAIEFAVELPYIPPFLHKEIHGPI